MKRIKEFAKWMKQNTNLGNSSIQKYSRAVNTISVDMQGQGVISKPLLAMNPLELDLAISLIMLNDFFVDKDITGHRMYSNALKQYRFFIKELNGYIVSYDIEKYIWETLDLTSTVRESIIESRVGQGAYRKNLLKKYDNECVVTGINNTRLLIASHIKPWVVSANDERLDAENGLLLSANIDRLFDNGLISFKNNGSLIISSFLGQHNEKKLSISQDMFVDLKTSSRLLNYLEYHRDIIFVK